MDAIWLLIGLLVGVALTLAATHVRFSARAAEAREVPDFAGLVAPIKDQLGRVDAQLIALDRERAESRGRLEQHLRMVADSNNALRSQTGALVTALRRPNVRGQWGQMQLRRVVEIAGMVAHCDFTEQASLEAPGSDGVLRPDLIVRLPGGKQVPVDAKAPLQAVLDAYEATDEQSRAELMHEHARLLRRHVRQLSDKAYWSALDGAPDFVVMFLPGEHLYAAAYEADPELVEDAMASRVLITTPTTLIALLHSVGYGWQQERVAQSAQEISLLGRDLHARLTRLSGLLATVGKRLGSTVAAYNEAVGSYEARVVPAARRFEELGVTVPGTEEQSITQITVAPRAVSDELAVTDLRAVRD